MFYIPPATSVGLIVIITLTKKVKISAELPLEAAILAIRSGFWSRRQLRKAIHRTKEDARTVLSHSWNISRIWEEATTVPIEAKRCMG